MGGILFYYFIILLDSLHYAKSSHEFLAEAFQYHVNYYQCLDQDGQNINIVGSTDVFCGIFCINFVSMNFMYQSYTIFIVSHIHQEGNMLKKLIY